MNLTDLTVTEIASLDKENIPVILPLGSIEQHGPHLPLGTKCYLSEAVAFAAAERLKGDNIPYLIAPVFPFMPCQSSCGFPGNYAMAARTFSDAIYEIGSSFSRDGFKYLYFVNLSISPDALKAVQVAVSDLNTLRDFQAFDPMPLWNFSKNDVIENHLQQIGLEPSNELHGDARETSTLYNLDPALVKTDIAAGLPPCRVNTTWEVLKGNFSFHEMGSEHGYLGTPSIIDENLGDIYLHEAAFGLSESVKFTLDGNSLPELPLQIRMLLKMVDLDEM